MKKMITLMALVAISMFAVTAAFAVGAGTLWEQENTATDGVPGVHGVYTGPAGSNPSFTNFMSQSGGGSYSGVYEGTLGELDANGGPVQNNMTVQIEADVEMYFTYTVANNDIYFHFGNISTATDADKTAIITGSMVSNHGQYIGLQFCAGKTLQDFDLTTGRIIGGMVAHSNSYEAYPAGTMAAAPTMDLQILMSYGAGWKTPDNFGDGSNGSVKNSEWWLVNNGVPGSYPVQWQVKLLPTQYQLDGDYELDPVVVVAPAL